VRESFGPEVPYFLYAFILFVMIRNVLFDIFIFVAYSSMHVWSVAWFRNNELSEHHS
jgi:hypothetical protein